MMRVWRQNDPIEHTFSWIARIEPQQEISLPFDAPHNIPPRNISCSVNKNSRGDHTEFSPLGWPMRIRSMACSRPDIVIIANVGTAHYVESGPWCVQGLMRAVPIIVPARQWVMSQLKSLAHETVLVNVWWRVEFGRVDP